jgi:L-fuculose-phosphate aldolase
VAAIGAEVEAAFNMAEKVEALARLYWQALQAGEPAILDEVEMTRVLDRFRTYGRE